MAPNSPRPVLRRHWPFRRLAVVLSGGGALGAYEVGVLKALDAVGLAPAIVIGLSVGAINAVVWTAHGFHSGALERAWSRIGPASVGMHWTSLAVRLAGLFLTLFAAVEIVLSVMGSSALSVAHLFGPREGAGAAASALFDVLAWALVGAAGYALARAAREVESRLAHLSARVEPRRWHRWTGRMLLAGAGLHLVAWAFDWPWPHRFGATVLVIGGLLWLLNRRGRTGEWMRRAVVRLLPESGGRGLWGGLARKRLLESLVSGGNPGRLVDRGVHLMVNALGLASGRMCYFVNWPDPSPEFRASMERALADVQVVTTPREVIRAAAASSAMPILFRPVRIGGREFLDAGMFSSRAIHAAIADGADAILVVLLSPAMFPRAVRGGRHLFEVGAWLLALGNWRDLRSELLMLPAPWTREGDPAPLCVVEPDDPLPGGMLRLDPRDAAQLMARGEDDAWRALERAGWVERPAV
jgi:predicted acylesterase/phospholipase RssA